MAKADSRPAAGGFSSIAVGIVAAIAAAAIFVVLTAATGTTYHLFPLLIAFVPAGLPRVMSERPVSRRDAMVAAIVGFAVVAAVWLTLELLDEMPSATLITDQPGGVPGEFVLLGLIGGLIGGWWGSRPA